MMCKYVIGLRARLAFLNLLALTLGAFVIAATAQTPAERARVVNPPADSSTPVSGRANYRIGPADVLLIEVAGEPDLKRKVKVTEQGTIRLPYIGHDLRLGGLTETQAAEMLNQEFLAILKAPQVTVFIEEYNAHAAAIAGAVREPKRVPLTREMRLYDLIALAGGLTEKASDVVFLIHTRSDKNDIETIDLKALMRQPELNRVIRDGDLVSVPENGLFYVTGNVNKPGSFALKERTTLTQALALAGGLMPDSKRREIKLVRGKDGQTTEQVVNLDAIEKDTSKDVLLQTYDVVLVPEATGKKQVKSLVQAFTGGIANALGWGILR
jgi:polysaccharide export outer membrane protein